ncbi:hypothetical protein AB7M35_001241 [Amorphus suaedae]
MGADWDLGQEITALMERARQTADDKAAAPAGHDGRTDAGSQRR